VFSQVVEMELYWFI